MGKNFEILSHEKEKCGNRLVGLFCCTKQSGRISVTDGPICFSESRICKVYKLDEINKRNIIHEEEKKTKN